VKNTLIEESCNRVGVAIGLASSPVGGKIQIIEATKLYLKNEKNRLIITGLAGKTLKESVFIAQNWVQSFVKKVNYYFFSLINNNNYYFKVLFI